MNRIDRMFAQNKQEGRKALITYMMAGEPDFEGSEALVLTALEHGADLVEIGIPYSDPVAEGPVIAAAAERAIRQGKKLPDYMAMVTRLREKTQAPLVFMMYYNMIFRYGHAKFFRDLATAGVDGVVVPDLPFEESEEVRQAADAAGVHLVSLVAPTSEDRVARIATGSRGFLYCVSSVGVTGVRDSFTTDFEKFFKTIDAARTTPTAIGFGISTPEHVRSLKKYADGLIIGSAIVRRIHEAGSTEKAKEVLGGYLEEIRAALDEK